MTRKALKILCLGILVLLLGIPSFAQNTKGDKPAPSSRETRFKTPKKQKQKRQTSRRVRRGDDKAGQPTSLPPPRKRTGERPGKPIRPTFSKSRPEKQRAWKGDITGRRIQPRSSAGRARNIYPQPESTNYSSRTLRRSGRDNENPNLKRVRRMQRKSDDKAKVGRPIRPMFSKSRPPKKERAWRGDLTGRRIRTTRSPGKSDNPLIGNAGRMQGTFPSKARRAGLVPGRFSGRAKNVYSTSGFWSRKPQLNRRGAKQSGAGVVAGSPGQRRRIGNRKIVPRSASASYTARRSTNPWAHFRRSKRKQGAVTTDLAGNKLRTRNFETQRPILGNPTLNYRRRMAAGERPYKGPAAGGHLSRSKTGQRAWRGDVTHRAIRGGKPPRHGERAFLGMLKGRGPGKVGGAATYKGNIRTGRKGFGDQGEEYSGNIRSHRFLKGGGSVSGRVWNNKGLPIQGKTPGKGAARIGYQGNIRVGKRGFTDQGEEYAGNIKRGRRGFTDQGEEYSGNIKRRRKDFNNQGEEYKGNIPMNRRRGFGDQGEEYAGNIKARRPDKGGGSRSGKIWNNNQSPIAVRVPSGKSARIAGYQGNIRAGRKGFTDQGEEYAGNIRARRPDKGGGSVSGKIWNNQGKPILGKEYSNQARQAARFTGEYKAKRPEKGGGSISGKLWNNNEKPILVRVPKNREGANFGGDVKLSRNHYTRNPNSAAGALRGEKASAATLKAQKYSRGVRLNWDYVKNPSSADAAQRTREPGKAFYRSGDYQGNIKLKRFDLSAKKERHPDARFVKTNKNNVAEEKDILTNFKLWWARLFRKSETQPDHLKEKGRKPRYDNGEAGLWYE